MSASSRRPRILVTNDDGYDAPGIAALIAALAPLGDLVVVAPDREQSASAHALTVNRPLRVYEVGAGRYRVDGTPTDCVHLALHRLAGARMPDLVVSGINRGLNIGDDLTYSGTVAGALEGALLHVPAVALSAASDERGGADYAAAADYGRKLCATVLERGLPTGVLLNVNVPSGAPRGTRLTRQGTRTYRATVEERLDPSGRPYYWIAGADAIPTGEADGDHVAIRDGFISVTPLHANLTHEPSLATLAGWPLEPGA
jgi:5'-nucleotidase